MVNGRWWTKLQFPPQPYYSHDDEDRNNRAGEEIDYSHNDEDRNIEGRKTILVGGNCSFVNTRVHGYCTYEECGRCTLTHMVPT